jgi:hypothetical protein
MKIVEACESESGVLFNKKSEACQADADDYLSNALIDLSDKIGCTDAESAMVCDALAVHWKEINKISKKHKSILLAVAAYKEAEQLDKELGLTTG